MSWWKTVPGRSLMLAISLSMLFSIATLVPGDAAATASEVPQSSDGVLVKVDTNAVTLLGTMSAVDAVEDIGFGWVFVSGDLDDPAFLTQVEALGTPHPDTIYELLLDPLFPDQWALENTGQSGGTVDADIDAPEAWAITEGNPNVVVAVLDTGADLDHPDLIDRIWTNPGEISGNDFDDDGNGYIDDVNGWDFYGDDGVTPDNDPSDITWHGTAVSGTVAASKNNIGIVGTSPQTTVMPIRVCYTSCPLSKIVQGIDYAIANGADVINISLGTEDFDQPMADAVAAANAAGIVVVAAAGNDGTDNDVSPLYPASFTSPNVISVAATNRFDELANFSGGSNYGATTVDLAAPGQDMLLATLNGGWTTNSGTSFSSPTVAGAVAMILTVQPGANPAEVKQILFDSVDLLPSLTGRMVTGGRLNMGTAIVGITTPIAVATASPSSGTLPFTTTINSAASFDPFGTIVGYSWLLPDGSTTTGPTLQWSPPYADSFDITLTVTDNDGLTASDTATITATDPPSTAPTAVADASPLSGTVPFDVTLDGTGSSDTGGSIVSWEWDSGTQTATGETPTITIDTAGTHTFTLTVTDNGGGTATDTVTITANAAPTAVANASPLSGTVPFDVTLDGSGSTDTDGTIVSWEWDSGTQTATGETPKITIDTAGTHTFTLTVTDNDGGTTTDTVTITTNAAPIAVADATPTAGTIPFTVTLDGTASSDIDGTIVSWEWDSGTYTATGETPTVTIDIAGTHIFTLLVTDNKGATATATVTIDANQTPTAVADASPLSGTVPFDVTLDGTASSDIDGTIASWDWDSGTYTAGGTTPTVTIDTPGTHTFTLTVTDSDGLTATDTVTITANEPPTAVASATPLSGTVPFTVTLNAEGSADNDGSIVSWEWASDAHTATGETPTITIDTAGTHTFTLTVTDDDGGTATDSVIITANRAPTAVADAAPLSGTVPFDVTLDGTGSGDDDGSVVSWDWDSEIYTAGGKTPIITIDTPGTHTFTMTVTDDDGGTATDTVTITATKSANMAPTAVASASPSLGVRPLDVAVSGSGSSDSDGSIVSWTWKVGGLTGSGTDATIVLHTIGVHDVLLTVTDDDGATDADTVTVLVGEDFLDTDGSVFLTDITWMSAMGITKGCNPPTNNRYCPDNTVTRGQMAAFLARALDLPATSTDFFTDDNGSIFENDINRLAAAGITKGCNPPTNNRYCPDNTVTRGQMAAFLSRSLNLPSTSTDFFVDDDDSIFENDINRLAAAGITKGCNPPTNNRYCPDNTVTRGQMAAFLHRANL